MNLGLTRPSIFVDRCTTATKWLTTKRLVTMRRASQSSFYGVSKVIDTATHVWGNGGADFSIRYWPSSRVEDNRCKIKSLDGHIWCTQHWLQPINYKFDHSYLDSILDRQFYGIFLINPQLYWWWVMLLTFKDKCTYEVESCKRRRGREHVEWSRTSLYGHGNQGLPVNVMFQWWDCEVFWWHCTPSELILKQSWQ